MENEADAMLQMEDKVDETEGKIYLMVDGTKITDVQEIVDYVNEELAPTVESPEEEEMDTMTKQLTRQPIEGNYEDPMLDLRLGG